MNNSKKRGFTIVELVIVIAVIAILAGVLIPTFSSVVNKANQANDTVLIKSLNTSLKSAEALNGKAPTMHDALQIVKEDGYDVSKIKSTASGSQILWDSANNCFVYVKEGVINYIPDSKTVTAQNYQLWTIVESGDLSTEYSNYLADGFTATGTLAITTGLDVGNVEGITAIEYVRTSGSAQEVIIRTNSSETTLTINAATDTVHHYGAIASVNVIACAPSSYHENGQVKGNINVAKGRIVVESTAKVTSVVITTLSGVAPTSDSVSVAVNSTEKPSVLVDSSIEGLAPTIEGVMKSDAIVVTKASLKNPMIKPSTDCTIVLAEDFKSESALRSVIIEAGLNVTLNLNGHSITSAVFNINGNLTIEGAGTISRRVKNFINVVNGGKLVVKGGTFESKSTSAGASVFTIGIAEGSEKTNTLIIEGGEIIAQETCILGYDKADIQISGGNLTSKNNFVVGTHGAAVAGAAITINGGTFNAKIATEGYIACGIYLANADTLTVNGGTFNITNGIGILVRAGSATIGNELVVNLNNTGDIASGKVGDANVKIVPSMAIVKEVLTTYPAGEPTIVNNSNYATFGSDGNEIK